MAQNFEYPMFSPHEPARLYKRLTNDMAIMNTGKIVVNGKEIADSDTITVQDNRYACVGSFRWIEETAKQDTDEQPLDGLIVPNSYVTIRTNSLKSFDDGDVIKITGDTPLAGFWLIIDGKTTDYIYTPKQIQTFQHLPISSAGL